MIKKILICALVFTAVLTAVYFWPWRKIRGPAENINGEDFSGERIVYQIKPAGSAEYNDLGIVNFLGKKMKLATFTTQVLNFKDTETIYSSPESLLPLRVERDISMWPLKENIVEEYDQDNFSIIIRKLKGKGAQEQILKAGGPIYNAVILPFYLRSIKELYIGWSMVFCFPQKFTVKLISEEEIEVPAGKFQAYHFTSDPYKFDIWISKDKLRLPLKIKGAGGLGYTLLLKERTLRK
ncbi:MAG: hypothetical protein V1925_03885 [Candidatus Omnitrophota bacterium]